MKEKEYPIKYALLPVKEVKYENGRDFYVNSCYIVSKAYVVEEYKKKNRDGEIKTTYKVCFPHAILDSRINYFRKTPDSALARDNEFVVSKLYDNYEDAKKQFDLLNINVDIDKLNNYEDLESEILELTKDLVVQGETDKVIQKVKRG